MNYHFKNKYAGGRKNRRVVAPVVILVLVLLLLGLFGGLFSGVVNNISSPFVSLSKTTKQIFFNLFSFMDIRSNLIMENRKYQQDIFKLELKFYGYDLLMEENKKLKEMLRISEKDNKILFANILMAHPVTPSDILIINIGSESDVKTGDFVAVDKIAIGTVYEVYKNTSKIKMFSKSGVETTGTIKNSRIMVEGNGGGNFKIEVPKNLEILVNDKFFIKNDYGTFVVGEVKDIEIKQSNYFKEVLLSIPVNILEVTMVQIFQ